MNAPASQLRAVATTMTGPEMAAVAKQTASQVGSATVKKFFESNKGTLLALLPKHFDAERMLKLALGALRTTPKLANASNASLLGAVVTCAQLGLEPNTPLGHAYLLPFDKREKRGNEWVTVETQVQVIIGYKGMLDLARRSGQIISIAAHEVCEHDEFRFAYGLDEELVHKPSLSARGNVIGFYAVAKLTGGGYSFEFMSIDEVNAIRDKSAEKNRAKKDNDGKPIITGPWADNYIEMGRKTVLRRLFKYLPISIESLAFAGVIDGNVIKQAAPIEEVAFDVTMEEEAPAIQGEPGNVDPYSTQRAEIAGLRTMEEFSTWLQSHDKPTKTALMADLEAAQERIKSGEVPAITFAQVADAMITAGDLETLELKADLINKVADPAHREELTTLYGELRAKLE